MNGFRQLNVSMTDYGYQILIDTNTTYHDLVFPDASVLLIIFKNILALIMSLITIVGNLFVIFAFIIDKKLQKYSNYFILNLSIADLLIGFLISAYVILNIFDEGSIFKNYACTTWLVLDYVSGSASVLCIVVISLDRYLLVSKGLKYIAKQKVFTAVLIIVTVWGIAFLNYAPGIIFWNVIVDKKSTSNVNILPKCKPGFSDNLIYLSITACVEFFFPLILISSLNLAVYFNIKKRSESMIRSKRLKETPSIMDFQMVVNKAYEEKKTENQNKFELIHVMRKSSSDTTSKILFEKRQSLKTRNKLSSLNENSTRKLNITLPSAQPRDRNLNNKSILLKINNLRKRNKFIKDKKSAKFLFILVFTFFCCWSPYTVLTLIKPICAECINDVLYEFTFWLLWFNSTMNPIIYPFLQVQFRSAFIKILHRLFTCRKAKRMTPV